MKETESKRQISQSWELLITKWIALSGTSVLLREKEEELEQRFSRDFLRLAGNLKEYENIQKEQDFIKREKEAIFYPLGEGGIFSGLWKMAEEYGKIGMDIDVRKIPIRQETVEITELYNLNPYLLHSQGSFLVAAPHGNALLRRLKEAGIEACIIGETTRGPARRLYNGEHIRYLDRPGKDELEKIGRALWQS